MNAAWNQAALWLALLSIPGLAIGVEKRRALVVPTQLVGYFPRSAEWRGEYDVTLEERLRAARYTVQKANKRNPSEAACHEAECLLSLVSAQHLDVATSAQVTNDEQVLTGYHVRVRVALGGATPTFCQRETSCVNCTEASARDMLATVLSEALDPSCPLPKPILRDPAFRPMDGDPIQPLEGVSDGGVATGGDDGAKLGEAPTAVSTGMKVAEGSLGAAIALGVVSMALGGKFLYDDGHPTCALVPPMLYCERVADTQGLGIGFMVAGSVIAVGAAAALVGLELKFGRLKHHLTLRPAVAPGGVGLSIGGSL